MLTCLGDHGVWFLCGVVYAPHLRHPHIHGPSVSFVLATNSDDWLLYLPLNARVGGRGRDSFKCQITYVGVRFDTSSLRRGMAVVAVADVIVVDMSTRIHICNERKRWNYLLLVLLLPLCAHMFIVLLLPAAIKFCSKSRLY